MRFESLTPVSAALRFVNSHGGIMAFVTPDGLCVRSEMVDTCKDAIMVDYFAALPLRVAAYTDKTCEIVRLDDADRVSEDIEVFPVSETGMVSISALRAYLGY